MHMFVINCHLASTFNRCRTVDHLISRVNSHLFVHQWNSKGDANQNMYNVNVGVKSQNV